jgi:hypothetical protein
MVFTVKSFNAELLQVITVFCFILSTINFFSSLMLDYKYILHMCDILYQHACETTGNMLQIGY